MKTLASLAAVLGASVVVADAAPRNSAPVTIASTRIQAGEFGRADDYWSIARGDETAAAPVANTRAPWAAQVGANGQGTN